MGKEYYIGVEDLGLIKNQVELGKAFQEWKVQPILDREKDSGEYDGGQGKLLEYLRDWGKEYMRSMSLVLVLNGQSKISDDYSPRPSRDEKNGNFEVVMDDLNLMNEWVPRDGYLVSVDWSDGMLVISKKPDDRNLDERMRWSIPVDNVVDMRWRRRSDSEIEVAEAVDGKIYIKTTEDLMKLMDVAAELGKEIRIVRPEEEDIVEILLQVGFDVIESNTKIITDCDKYTGINNKPFESLGDAVREGCWFEFVEPQEVYNKRS